MTFRERIAALKLSNTLLWRCAFGTLLIISISLAGFVWLSGKYETRDALKNGRRLLIRLDNGTIEGHQIAIEKKDTVAAATPTSDTPSQVPASVNNEATTPQTPEATSPTSLEASPTTPDTAVSESENFDPTKAPILANTDPIPPATVPLAGLNQALMEKSSVGMLPVVGKDGNKSWRYYAKPFERKGNLPMIAIIVTGLGQNKTVTDGAIRLPENFTLSFTPYAKEVASWANSSRAAGHEVLIDLPLEPSNYPSADPGPYGLLVSKGTHENASRLQWLMSRIQGYVGFITPQNEVLSANDEAFKAVLQSLANRGLMMAIGHELARNETKQTLDSSTVPYIVADVLLDEELSATAIQARLISLEKIASKRGYAIGVVQAFPISIQQLNNWAAKLENSGFVLVPLTFLAKFKFS